VGMAECGSVCNGLPNSTLSQVFICPIVEMLLNMFLILSNNNKIIVDEGHPEKPKLSSRMNTMH